MLYYSAVIHQPYRMRCYIGMLNILKHFFLLFSSPYFAASFSLGFENSGNFPGDCLLGTYLSLSFYFCLPSLTLPKPSMTATKNIKNIKQN